MLAVKTIDVTLSERSAEPSFGFRDKVELVKELDRLNFDIIELAELKDVNEELIFYKTIAPLVKNSVLSFPFGEDKLLGQKVFSSLSGAFGLRAHVAYPVSDVQMEYICGKKPAKVLEAIAETVKNAREICETVEFCAEDAFRSEPDFLVRAVNSAIDAGAGYICICDSTGAVLPAEVSELIRLINEKCIRDRAVFLSVKLSDEMNMGVANVFSAFAQGAAEIKTSLCGAHVIHIGSLANAVALRGNSIGVDMRVDITRLWQALKRVDTLKPASPAALGSAIASEEKISLNEKADLAEVSEAISLLGYELNESDRIKVYEAFCSVVRSKTVGARELEAIIASEAHQVPQTFKLVSFVTNSGNIINSTANIYLEKNGKLLNGLCGGDGPIDASFMAIEKIVGQRYELDDFQIQAVTEGKEALGEAIVKLRYNGTLYSGRGISTDIIASSIRAYLNALNKIVYEKDV